MGLKIEENFRGCSKITGKLTAITILPTWPKEAIVVNLVYCVKTGFWSKFLLSMVRKVRNLGKD